jgi:coenzyme F420-reducing hydrogenase delta subunit
VVWDLGFVNWDLRIIVFTCNWNAYSGLETAGHERLSLPAGVRPVKVMCLGRLHPGLVLKAFELGADGVLMLGCPPGGCRYEFGNSRAEELFEETKALARLLGIGEERLQLDWVAAGDGEAFAEKVRHFAAGIEQAVSG